MNALTPRQSEVLDFIKWHKLEHQGGPTMEEIAMHFEFKSNNTAYEHVMRLKRKGAIELVGKGRNIKVLGCQLIWLEDE